MYAGQLIDEVDSILRVDSGSGLSWSNYTTTNAGSISATLSYEHLNQAYRDAMAYQQRHYQQALYPPPQMAYWDSGATPEMPQHHTVDWNPNTMQYETPHQKRRIKELEDQLEKKEIKRKESVKSLIAYYYNRK